MRLEQCDSHQQVSAVSSKDIAKLVWIRLQLFSLIANMLHDFSFLGPVTFFFIFFLTFDIFCVKFASGAILELYE